MHHATLGPFRHNSACHCRDDDSCSDEPTSTDPRVPAAFAVAAPSAPAAGGL